jgi:tryptophan synthase beta chain
MFTLGCEFQPAPNHAGGLRYHGMSPIISQLYFDGIIDEARAIEQRRVFQSAMIFAKAEGILPAPESSHAIHVAIEEAVAAKQNGTPKIILFGLSGTGYFDMTAYQQLLDGSMTDRIPTDKELQAGFAELPQGTGLPAPVDGPKRTTRAAGKGGSGAAGEESSKCCDLL